MYIYVASISRQFLISEITYTAIIGKYAVYSRHPARKYNNYCAINLLCSVACADDSLHKGYMIMV